MKHIFIVNPKSGKKDSTEYIKSFLEKNYSNLDYEVYNTTGVGDATDYVKKLCDNKTDSLTFYACGGDGTLNEVVNGIYGYDNVYITAYPCGSGNDFIKVFGQENYFKDLNNIINGESRTIDILKINDRLCINMCNLGFDGAVANNVTKFKKLPLVSGKGAYNLSLVYTLIFGMKHKCKVHMDDELIYDGNILLSAVGNGLCCGGGYYCLPKADIEDGLIDAVTIKKISRFTFMGMVGKYKKGTYLEDKKYEKILKFRQCKKFVLEAEKEIPYCIDGECSKAKKITISIIKKAINFIVPKQYAVK